MRRRVLEPASLRLDYDSRPASCHRGLLLTTPAAAGAGVPPVIRDSNRPRTTVLARKGLAGG